MHATGLLTTDIIGGDCVATSARKISNGATEGHAAEVALNGHRTHDSRNGVDNPMNGNKPLNGTNGDASHGLVKTRLDDTDRLSTANSTSHDAPAAWKVIPQSLAESVARTKAEYRQVGTSGLRVSNPILGTLCIGDPNWMNWILPEEEVGCHVPNALVLHLTDDIYRRSSSCWRRTREGSILGTL
ncbi:hypothetical protein MRB53_041981 [Persea americana]|nr:hypothetical protein MRB53_041981 [Persea americana]